MKKYTVMTIFVTALAISGCSSTPKSTEESALEGAPQGDTGSLSQTELTQPAETTPSADPLAQTPSAPDPSLSAPSTTSPLLAEASATQPPAEPAHRESPVDLGASSAGRSH